MLTVTCFYCGELVDPMSRYVYRRIQGWERKAGTRASGKHGGSDITLREPVDEWACPACISKRRSGVNVHQAQLL